VEAPTLQRIITRKEEQGLRIFGLALNGGVILPSLKELCDYVVDLDKLRAAGAKEDAMAGALP
jgi:hypothetical protein